MARRGVTTVIDNAGKFYAAVDLLGSTRVMVGVPESKDSRRESGELGNAEIGYLMENGIPENNVPARPHLVPGVKDARSKIVAYLRQAGELAFAGRPDVVLRALNAAGLAGQSAVKARIRAGVPPPLAESTLARRKAEGFSGEKPLIRTGQYLAAISYVLQKIKRKKK